MNRIAALSQLIRDTEADALLLSSEIGVTYATASTALEGKCMITKEGAAYFITDGRYIERAQQFLTPQGFAVSVRQSGSSESESLLQLLQAQQISAVLFEDHVISLRQYETWKQSLEPIRLLPLGNRLAQLRACKAQEEIDAILHAQRIAEHALEALLPSLQAGITEREAAAKLDYLMALGGSEMPSFQTILLFGAHASMPHGVPGNHSLKDGDVILVDFGAVYHGYHSDMTRTFAYGAVSDRIRSGYEAVLHAQEAAMEQARAGLPCRIMHEAAVNALKTAGWDTYFTHALGHSVGLEIHEFPSAAPNVEHPLQNGMIMTVEPGIYLPGEFGIRIEDMIVIQGDTPRNLTAFPKQFRTIGNHNA